MAKAAGLSVEILDEKKIAEMKMGALLSVAQGSVEPPRMIVITYNPPSAKPGAPVIGLVGKADDRCAGLGRRSEEHTSELQSRRDLVCRLLLEKKKKKKKKKKKLNNN